MVKNNLNLIKIMWKFALGFILCISLGLANEEPSLGRQQ
ncbi:MAG: hypothetical protein RL637_715, partial [Pseudomonadota bacterium]